MSNQRQSRHANHREGLVADTIGSHLNFLRDCLPEGELRVQLSKVFTDYDAWHEKFNRAVDAGEIPNRRT